MLLPAGAPLRAAAAAVAELAPWIERQLAERARAARAAAPRRASFPTSTSGSRSCPQPGRARVHRRGGDAARAGRRRRATRAIERWYRRAARAEIAARLDRASAASGAPYTRLTIRNQRTRWASCASGGAMSFNWRLLLAPERVLDYVVWHEVCHLEVADHSPRFWALLESRCPGWREPAALAARERRRTGVVNHPRRRLRARRAIFVPSLSDVAESAVFVAVAPAPRSPRRRSGALAARSEPIWASCPRGDLLVTFSGTRRRRLPLPRARAGGAGRRVPGARHELRRDRHLQLERHVRRAARAAARATRRSTLAGGGQLTASEQLGPCAGAAAVDEHLHAVAAAAASGRRRRPRLSRRDVVASGRLVTVGALGELLRGARSRRAPAAARSSRTSSQGYSQLQASVSVPARAAAAHRRLRGAVHDGRLRPLRGRRAERQLQLDELRHQQLHRRTCRAAAAPPSSCSFDESYSGTIEVRVVR